MTEKLVFFFILLHRVLAQNNMLFELNFFKCLIFLISKFIIQAVAFIMLYMLQKILKKRFMTF